MRKRPRLLPGNARSAVKVELPVQLAWEALGRDWFSLDHIIEIATHADAVRAIAEPGSEMAGQALAILRAAETILYRYQRTGKVGVSGDEARALKEALAITIPWVRLKPNHVLHTVLTRRRK